MYDSNVNISSVLQPDLFKALKPSTFAKHNFEFIKIHTRTINMPHRSNKISARAPQDMFERYRNAAHENNTYCNYSDAFYKELVTVLHQYYQETDRFSFWTWMNYRTVIELAGHLE